MDLAKLTDKERFDLRVGVMTVSDGFHQLECLKNHLEKVDKIDEHLELCALLDGIKTAPGLRQLWAYL